MPDEVPYQVAPQVAQLRAERANALALGLADRVAAVDKQLQALGVAAAEKRKAAAEEDNPEAPVAAAPRDRQSSQKVTG